MQKTVAIIILFGCLQSRAQNVGIGTTTPTASAQLEISSSTKGFLIPRMTTAQRNAIAGPVLGLQIFNLDDQCTDIYDGANWNKNCGLKVISTTTDPGHPSPNSWTQKANFGGTARDGGVGFSIGSKGYIGTGASGNSAVSNDFWEYNPATNAWAQKANVGGKARSNAVGFSIGSKGYIGTGQSSGQSQNDFWEYNPITNVWTQKANIGVVARFYAVGFSIGSKGYVGIGFNGFNQNDFWEYDPATDAWTSKATFPGFRNSAVGFSIGSKGYVGTGFQDNNFKNDFWEYDPASNTWVQKANFGGEARFRAVGFSIGNKGFIGSGSSGGQYHNDFWEYDPATNAWIQKADFGGTGRRSAVGFAIGIRGFLGTGGTYNGTYTNDFWEYLDYNIYTTYGANTISSEYNTITDGAWTLANGTVYNSNSGNVGIGTSSPLAKLHISATSGSVLRLDASANASAFSMSGSGSFNIDAVNIVGGRLVVKDDGKVGIGTNAPTALLDVAGTLNANSWKTQSATANGYANMGGVLMQWGTINYNNSSSQTINFPVGFTEVFSVTLTIDNNNNTNSSGSNVPPKLVVVGNTSFQIGGMQTFDNDNTCKVRWMAVGR